MDRGTEAQKYVWGGAIPLQIHLHESEVTTLPPPPPVMILAPRTGYLPLLVDQIKPLFHSALPPGVDTIWFEYKGLPLKWYIPTGVLFDLLCAEPERPWNLTVHFRGYPANVLIPCDGEDDVKWSFINSLKEAAYIINGNCKNVMNMSQSDQLELWHSVLNGNLESFLRVASKLKLSALEDEFTAKLYPSLESQANSTDNSGPTKTGRIPVRLYVWNVSEDFVDLENAPDIDSWDRIAYINRPIEVHRDEGKCFTLNDALKALLPEYFGVRPSHNDNRAAQEVEEASSTEDTVVVSAGTCETVGSGGGTDDKDVVKLVRIQGIEPKLEIPFSWVMNNLMNPDHFLHICLYLKSL